MKSLLQWKEASYIDNREDTDGIFTGNVSTPVYCRYIACCNVFSVCQGERGPIGPAMIGPRGIPGIPGERGQPVSVTLVSFCLLIVFLATVLDRKLLAEIIEKFLPSHRTQLLVGAKCIKCFKAA